MFPRKSRNRAFRLALKSGVKAILILVVCGAAILAAATGVVFLAVKFVKFAWNF